MKKNIFILLTIACLPLFAFRPGVDSTGADAPVTGFINIVVESNVNKVNFSYPISQVNLRDETGPETNAKTAIVVPVKDFRCDNKVARRDFLELLQADRYPDLSIEIPRKVLTQLRFRRSVTLHNILINIAGVTKAYDITCREEDDGAGGKILVGTIIVPLSDLNINPPSKFFGMVKIKNDVIVKFGLGFKDQSYARK